MGNEIQDIILKEIKQELAFWNTRLIPNTIRVLQSGETERLLDLFLAIDSTLSMLTEEEKPNAEILSPERSLHRSFGQSPNLSKGTTLHLPNKG